MLKTGLISILICTFFVSLSVAKDAGKQCESFVSAENPSLELTQVGSSHILVDGKVPEEVDAFEEITEMRFTGCLDMEALEADCRQEGDKITMAFKINPANSCESMDLVKCGSWDILFGDLTLLANILTNSCPVFNLSKLAKIEVTDGNNTMSVVKCDNPDFKDHFVFSCPENVDSGKSKWQMLKDRFKAFFDKLF